MPLVRCDKRERNVVYPHAAAGAIVTTRPGLRKMGHLAAASKFAT